MVCKKCAAEFEGNLQFCPKCGCETGYSAKPVNTGKKLGILSIVFSFDITIIGLILGIIGLVKGIKSKDKISIILNSIGILISIVCTIAYTIYAIRFFNGYFNLVNSFV